MKVFISADIEGVNGISHWDETNEAKRAEYDPFARRMTLEVAAVCEGINDFAPDAQILVKDAHGCARNMDHELLPKNVDMHRNFSGHPFMMMEQIDKTFDAAILTGYHAPGYMGGNPLAHTLSGIYNRILINGRIASEFLVNYYTAIYHGVPVVMVTGDERLCALVNETDADIIAVPAVRGEGAGMSSPHPAVTRELFRESAKTAAESAAKLKQKCTAKLPASFAVEIRYREHHRAQRAAHYPGAKKTDAHTITFDCEDYFEFLRLVHFV